ncbi:MAG: hypothetical protein ACREMZ_01935 [Gemmatimonadales bacterium]
MTYIVKLARRTVLLPALALALACDATDTTEPVAAADAETAPAALPAPSFSSGFRGGIPIGMGAQPTSAFGDLLNGALRNIWPKALLSELAAIKARGGKVVLTFTGAYKYYLDGDGHFDLGKWKARVDRFKGVNFSSYIGDGTIVGHLLIDEPNDRSNWNGKLVLPAVVEEMAQYSKQLWPNLVTIARAQPAYLNLLKGDFRYLDAGWAQYVTRKGTAEDYIQRNVADAQKKGLGLVVGLNISKGNVRKTELSAEQIEAWGSAMLSSTYPCAFISWKYDADYVERAEIREAMASLAEKAQNRPTKSCRGANTQTPEPEPPPPEEPPPAPEEPPPPPEEPPPPPPEEPPAPPAPPASAIQLTATGPLEKNDRHYLVLNWSGAAGSRVDLYRDGVLRKWNPTNTGRARVSINPKSRKPAVFKVCELGTSRCSNGATVTLSSR